MRLSKSIFCVYLACHTNTTTAERRARNSAGAETLAVARRPEEESREKKTAAAGIERFFSLKGPREERMTSERRSLSFFLLQRNRLACPHRRQRLASDGVRYAGARSSVGRRFRSVTKLRLEWYGGVFLLLQQRSKHPQEMVITPKASTSLFVGVYHLFIALPTCKAYTIAILLHDYCAIYAPPPDPPCECHTPYNIGNGNSV